MLQGVSGLKRGCRKIYRELLINSVGRRLEIAGHAEQDSQAGEFERLSASVREYSSGRENKGRVHLNLPVSSEIYRRKGPLNDKHSSQVSSQTKRAMQDFLEHVSRNTIYKTIFNIFLNI